MFIPEIKTNAGRAYMTQFQGLNRQERSEANELSDCMNVTSDAYPCIASAKIPEKVISQADIQAVHPQQSFLFLSVIFIISITDYQSRQGPCPKMLWTFVCAHPLYQEQLHS